MPFFAWMLALILAAAAAVMSVSLIQKTGRILYAPAAAAASAGSLFALSGRGLSELLGSGLLLRRRSALTAGGE